MLLTLNDLVFGGGMGREGYMIFNLTLQNDLIHWFCEYVGLIENL